MGMLAAGFAEPVFEAQAVFRAAMSALARPGALLPFATCLESPAPLSPGLAALALTLVDHETPIWLDGPLARADGVAAFLTFHTAAPITAEPREAAFALISDFAACPSFDRFAQGSSDYPDRSTTLLVAVDRLSVAGGLVLRGPGIPESATLGICPVPGDLPDRWRENGDLFPCGIDLLLNDGAHVAGLPRSVRISGG